MLRFRGRAGGEIERDVRVRRHSLNRAIARVRYESIQHALAALAGGRAESTDGRAGRGRTDGRARESKLAAAELEEQPDWFSQCQQALQ